MKVNIITILKYKKKDKMYKRIFGKALYIAVMNVIMTTTMIISSGETMEMGGIRA